VVGGIVANMNPLAGTPGVRIAGSPDITPTIGEKETMRHNPVMERIGQGNLGVAQGNLGVARGNLGVNQSRLANETNPALQETLAASRSRGTHSAEQEVKAVADLPKIIDNANIGIKAIDDLIGDVDKKGKKKPHPGFTGAVGATLTPGMRFVEGSDEADFMKRLDQIKGGAFLQAYETLKGTGQITEVEGLKATQAITRMDKAQSEKEFVTAAREFQDVIRKGVDRARAKTKPSIGGKAAPSSLSDDELRKALGL